MSRRDSAMRRMIRGNTQFLARHDSAGWVVVGTMPAAITSWTDAGTPSEVTGVTDHLGGTAAVTTGDNDAGNYEGHTYTSAIALTSGVAYRTTTWVKKDTDTTRFPEFQNVVSSGFAHWQINTQTGAASVRSVSGFTGTSVVAVEAASGWWRVYFYFTPNISTTFVGRVYAAMSNSLAGAPSAANVGTVTWVPGYTIETLG